MTASACTVVTEDRKPDATSSASRTSAKWVLRALFTPRSDRDQRNTCGFEHDPTMEARPSRLRDGPEVGHEGPEPFRRLDPSSSINSSPYLANSRSASLGFLPRCAPGSRPPGTLPQRLGARRPRARPLLHRRTCLEPPSARRAPRGRGGEAAANPRPRRAPTRRTSRAEAPWTARRSPRVPAPPTTALRLAQAADGRARARPRGRPSRHRTIRGPGRCDRHGRSSSASQSCEAERRLDEAWTSVATGQRVPATV